MNRLHNSEGDGMGKREVGDPSVSARHSSIDDKEKQTNKQKTKKNGDRDAL